MYEKDLALSILSQVEQALHTTLDRFEEVQNVDFFTNSPKGAEKLDSICMQLIAIGESLKNIDKITNHSLLQKYPEVDWRGAKGMRDIISHHYFDIDANEIYFVCANKLQPLLRTVEQIKLDIRTA